MLCKIEYIGNGNHTEQQKEKQLKIWKPSKRSLKCNMKYINILIIGIPEKKREREREEGWKCISRNYSWKLSNPEEEKKYPGTGSREGLQNKMNSNDPHQDIS